MGTFRTRRTRRAASGAVAAVLDRWGSSAGPAPSADAVVSWDRDDGVADTTFEKAMPQAATTCLFGTPDQARAKRDVVERIDLRDE